MGGSGRGRLFIGALKKQMLPSCPVFLTPLALRIQDFLFAS